VLAGAGTVASAVRTTRALDRLLADDLAALRALRDAQEDRTVRRGVAEAARVEAAAALEEAQQARAEAERTAGERKALLAVVRRERGLRERMAAELLAAAVDLEEELKRLKAGPPSGPSFETLKGALPHPCEGPVEVGFGRRVDPRFGTVTLQKGWDIRAAEGTPVYAVASATVRHAGWFRGYGNLLILDHGGGWYTLYAHLGALMRVGGERVEIGEQLGEVGDTGSLKGPYLYFEVRNGQKALDPAEWVPVPVR
jgi:murein DD-endopeptidase MepM/ murein hydrolase activator NlpD